jgi:hypothetical protein
VIALLCFFIASTFLFLGILIEKFLNAQRKSVFQILLFELLKKISKRIENEQK